MKPLKLTTIALTLSGILSGCGSGSSSSSAGTPPTEPPPEVLPPESSTELFRAKWNSYSIGDNELTFDSALNAQVDNLNRQTKGWLTNQLIAEDGTFADLPITEQNIDSQLRANYLRLLTMAGTYALETGELSGDEELKNAITTSLTRLNQHYYHHQVTSQPGNWWYWQIGSPKAINDILMLMKDALPAELINQYVLATRHFVPDPTTINVGGSIKPSVGANLVDTSQVVLLRGVLAENNAEIAEALEAVSTVIDVVDSGDGFYADDSFIQHQDIAYTGTYGNELLKGLALIIGSAQHADLLKGEDLQRIYPILLDSFSPFLVNGRMMDSVNGRAIARTSGQNDKLGHAIINSMLLYLASAPETHRDELAQVIKTQIENDQQGDFFASIGQFYPYQMARALVDDQTVEIITDRHEHKQFAAMDRVVHHRPTWSFALAMHSARVGNYECINNENQRGWYTGDGVTYLYNSQDHYRNYWPVVDAHQLPGTTVLNEVRQNCSGQRSEQREGRQGAITWSGGASLGQYGIAGFNFTNYNDLLSAKKSWFMFDDAIVALGSNITNNSSTDALTVMENRKIANDATVTVNGAPLAANSSAEGDINRIAIEYDDAKNPLQYLMLSDHAGTVTRECRSGNWSDIGVNQGNVTACFAALTLSHNTGNTAQDQSYQYAIIPDKQNGYTPEINVLSNNHIAHVVEHTALNLISANFWQAGTVGTITANTPMALMMKTEADGALTLSVSDPMWSSQSVSFALGHDLTVTHDPQQRVAISAQGIVTVRVNDLHGESYTFSLVKE